MPEEKRDWVIGEGNPFPKTPIERWDANICVIRLSRQLEKEGRSATFEEQGDLAKYSGLGDSAFEQAFSYYGVRDHARQKRRAELEELVSDEQLEGIRRSRIYAFYTTPEIVRAVWKGLSDMGVDKLDSLNVLEPSAGSGRFMGLQPRRTAMKSKRTAVELDPRRAGTLKHFYPETKVYVGGIQEAPIPDNRFGIAISSVPFGKVKVYDPEINASGRKFLTGSVHNYFSAKTLDREMREMAKDLGPDALRPQRTIRCERLEDFSKAQRKRQPERLVLEDGQLRLSEGTSSRKPDPPADEIQRITVLISLWDTARKLVTMEAEDGDNYDVERTRGRCDSSMTTTWPTRVLTLRI